MTRYFLIISIIIANVWSTFAKEQFIYNQISQKEGLTSTINCIYKEPGGNVWICSRNGLYRFNGDFLHHFTEKPFENKRVFSAAPDTDGNLWIMTNDHLIVKRAGSKEFEEVRSPKDSTLILLSMCCNKDYVWFGGVGRIFRYSDKDRSLTEFCKLEKKDFRVKNMHITGKNEIICCSHNGTILVDMNTGEFRTTPYTSRGVSASFIDSKGRLWLAYYNNGIEVYDTDGRTLRKYNVSNSDLSSDIVLCMTEREGVIWAGTDGGGLNLIDLDKNSITVLSHVSGDPSSFPAHSIKSVCTDYHGNIWAGSIRDGLINISQSKMNTYTDVHLGLKTGLSNPTVLCLHQEPGEEDIWIGTDGEGINRFNPLTNEFTHYPATFHTKVVSITSFSSEELAISVYADRVWLFNKNNGSIRPLEVTDKHFNYQMKFGGVSINLHSETSGGLLLISNIVRRFDHKTGLCSRIPCNDGIEANWNFFTIGKGREGLWMHDNFSIYLLPDGADKVQRIATTDKHRIRCGHIGQDNVIWLATDSGLCRYDIGAGSFNHLHTSLLNDISSVICDNSGRVWIGNDKHLFAYLKTSDSFALFGASDGAFPNEFLSKPRLLTEKGEVYLGGVQGLLRIDPDYTIDSEEEPFISLYELAADNCILSAGNDGIIHIPDNSRTLTISVAAHEKDLFRKKMYRFMFPGSGREFTTTDPTLTLNQIPSPGKYDVLVSCSKRDGEWSTPQRILTMRVPQPWYSSWWFITIAILAACGITTLSIFTIRQRRINRQKLAQKEQEQLIYEEKVGLLINISHELRTPLTLIMAPLKRLIGGMAPGDDNFSTLNRIYRQSRRMRDLLNMVLDLRKMEVGKSQLKIEALDMNLWILDTVEDFVNEEQDEGISVITDLDSDISLVEFDKQKCETILTNLLINAIKHSHSGETITISTQYLRSEEAVRISVRDEGPGLRDIDHTKLFTRFYQNRNEKYGSGIGLSYSKILVELHGGKIGAENNTGAGATFWWTLPLHQNVKTVEEGKGKEYLNELAGEDQGQTIGEDSTLDVDTTNARIMLVDDNRDLLEFLQDALSSSFKEIIPATGGDMAMQMIHTGKLPDLIVSDVNMPDGDGYSLCRALKANERYNHIPVILLTALGNAKSQSDSYRAGADAFLAKPFEIDILMDMIKSQLRHKEEIRKRYLDKKGDTEKSHYGSNEEGFIIRLNKIISENLDNPALDQQMLCREMGMSRASLFNKMKSITGTGAKEYINKIRIEKAKALMETTDLTIAEVSDRTGFASQSYFSTAFKAYTGLSPRQFRQQHRAQS